MISAIALLAAVFYLFLPLENEPSPLTIQHGDVVSEISSSIFIDTYWVEQQTCQSDLSGATIFIVIFNWPGNAACLTVFKAVDSGFQFLGEFTNAFGGNGIDFSVLHISVKNEELYFRIEWTGHLRGYLPDPENPKTYIPPEDVTSSFIMATDGDTLRMIEPSSFAR